MIEDTQMMEDAQMIKDTQMILCPPTPASTISGRDREV